MEDSFNLLSTMSPKLVKSKKVKKIRAPTVLSLKKHVRRSSVLLDKIKSNENESLILVEENSSETVSSHSSAALKGNCPNNVPVIVISDSENSQLESSDMVVNRENCDLSDTKFEKIAEWVSKVNREYKALDISDCSVEIPDDGLNISQQEETNIESVSTYNVLTQIVEGKCAVKNDEENVKKKNIGDALRNSCDSLYKEQGYIEDSFELNYSNISRKESNNEINKKNEVHKDTECVADSFELKLSVNSTKDKDSVFEEEGIESSNNSFKSCGSFESSLEGSDSSVQKILDDLYGKSWREKKNEIIPKTEPKPKKKPNISNAKPTFNTEMKNTKKKKSSIFINPYLSPKNTPIQRNTKLPAKSPWTDVLKRMCDSETTDSDGDKKVHQLTRTKLDFKEYESDMSEDASKNNECDQLQKKFEDLFSDMENEFKSLREKLEERLNAVNIKSKNDGKDKRDIVDNKRNADCTNTKKTVSNHVESKDNTAKHKTNNKNKDRKPKVKTRKKKKARDLSPSSSSSSEINVLSKSKPKGSNRNTTNRYLKDNDGMASFLASLSATVPPFRCDPSALIFRNNFGLYKDKLVQKLFALFNEKVFDRAIPEDTPIQWNNRMRGTAGFCYCVKVTKSTGQIIRKVRIVLATKVLDSADRLRNTLIHEMCHAGAWIVNQVSNGHGPHWMAWAQKAMSTFPELPPIKRCHNYAIYTKYTYRCTYCGHCIGRHSKSLDITRKRCGYCYGIFELLINKKNKTGEVQSVPITPKKEATGFALFVKNNYAAVKTPRLNHGDVMKILGQKFAEMKVKDAK